MKVSKKVAILVGLVVVFVATGVTVTSVATATKAMLSAAEVSLTNQVLMDAKFVRVALDGDLSVMEELANRPNVRAMDWDMQRVSLREDVERISVMDIAVVTRDGTARYVKEGNQSNLGERDYVQKALSGENAVSDVIISKVIGKAVLMMAVPIYAHNGQVAGALVARKDATAMNEIVNNLDAGDNGFFFIVDKSGVYMSHPDSKQVYDQFNPIKAGETEMKYADLSAMLVQSLQIVSGIKSYIFDGNSFISAFYPVEGMPWKLYMNIDRDEYLGGISHLQTTLIIMSIIFLVIGIALAYMLGRSISKPIVQVTETLKDISGGEGDLRARINIQSKDEFGDLASYYNRTIEKIQKMIAGIKNQTNLLDEVGNKLSANMSSTATAMNEITSNIQSIKTRVANQSDSVRDTSAQAKEINSSASNLDGEIEQQRQALEKAQSSVNEVVVSAGEVAKRLEENVQNVKALGDASEIGRVSLQDVASNISEISRESEGLLEINDVIKRIASQTNLLSMNAAIEAAHAGEAGKGFAVVADEIRKLAESSSEQSATISAVLKKITGEISTVMKSTDAVLNKFEAIDSGIKTVATQEEHIRTSMEEQQQGRKQILEAMEKLNLITHNVKDNSSLMTASSRKIENGSRSLEDMTCEITNGITEMAIGAQQINTSVTELSTISSSNKESIACLVKEVSHFKIDGDSDSGVVGDDVGDSEPFVPYTWDGSLAVGQSMIDSQHEELFAKINNLLSAIHYGKGKDELKESMDFLSAYTIKHFFEEEQLQKKYDYPDFENHHNIHEGFKATVKELSHELILKGASDHLLQDVKRKTALWLIAHIKVQDKRLGAFIKSKM
ncbi:MAG: cache domain-containing protein [Termitinemataceae bacterium]|nr:MAG: cache domain-containing protein [Termitinemataceae bacterium]